MNSTSSDNMLNMTIKDIAAYVEGTVVSGNEQLEKEVEFAFASDLMSDVLTVQKDNLVLLTGLSNVQTIRTAEMSDISCIIFVRNKKVTADMLKLGRENGIVMIECPFSMFKASGMLYSSGLKPIY